ncbi:MAG TPA: bifunctional methylenetetrahydrofolate dehydrogenase/methenyltetrahydrofolate cyclohydrolase [Chlamydiae bacterium]|nr:bifunctional methylenetetrahydrofolate dehydrogenase/methenyltetrahydrofolate cyclohydrolase [Chlamydiota bacterium]
MIINGTKIAKAIALEIKEKIFKHKNKPNLSVILVGRNPASLIYIRMKKKACEKVGIDFNLHHFKEEEKEGTILNEIDKLNQNDTVNGILVQMPLPKQISNKKVIERMDPNKDVDGFHPVNVGKMLIGDDSGFLSCTPLGIKTLLTKSNIEVESKHVVILGRSNIVGKPLAAILMQKKPHCNATVTVCHSYSKNLKEITRSADILVAAIGKPKFVTQDMVKDKAIVIDVGINYVKQNDGTTIVLGDVDFENVSKIASQITPVPKGVGPMTVVSLLQNTYMSFYKKNEK